MFYARVSYIRSTRYRTLLVVFQLCGRLKKKLADNFKARPLMQLYR